MAVAYAARLSEGVAVDGITIPDEKAWRFVVGKGVNDLLSGPPRSRMSRDVKVSDRSAVVTERDEAIQDAKRGGRNREEVNRDDVGQMIVEKGAPSLRRRLPMSAARSDGAG